ncbi:MAG: hypothetical protein EWM51_12605, partial [Treponema sp.]
MKTNLPLKELTTSVEKEIHVMNGWLVLVCFLFAVVFALLMMIFGIRMQGPSIIIPGALLEALLFSLILPGFFTLQPN